MNNVKDAISKPNTSRSDENIRQDIAKEKENISHTVEQIGAKIKSKMDWREQVGDYPYVSLGVAAGCGYLASKVLIPRPSPVERLLRPFADEVHHALENLLPGSSRPGIIRLTVVGIATKVATNMLKNATTKVATSESSEASPPPGRGSTSGMPHSSSDMPHSSSGMRGSTAGMPHSTTRMPSEYETF